VGSDRALRTLRLGRKDETQDGVWATRADGGELFLVPGDLLAKIEKPVQELRDRRVLPLERDQVARLEWRYPEGPVVARKLEQKKDGGDRWRLEAPLAIPADSSAISSLLFDLESLKAEEFVGGPSGKLGLEPPQWTLALQVGGARRVLEVGNAHQGQPWTYVRNPAGQLMAVKDEELKRIRLGSFELREKLLLDFRREQIEKIEAAAGGQRLVVSRDGEEWRQEVPVRRALAEEQLNDLIWAIDYVQMEKVFEEQPAELARYGLAAPLAQVTVWTRGGKRAGKLLLGTAVPAVDSEPEEEWIYAYVEDRTPVCAVDAATLKSIRDALNSLLKGGS
jgi:hypothetical protein